MQSTLISIQVGLPQHHGTPDADDPLDRPWFSGYYKHPVAGAVFVGRTNLQGDGQGDLTVHGGPEKAVLAYSADHYAFWREILSTAALPHGAFGENLTIAGLDESLVCIGDVFSLGDASLQVSQPRRPCWKLARRWRMTDLPQRVIENGRSGWYFRVLEEGFIQAGASIVLKQRPFPQWTVARANHVMHREKQNKQLTAALADCSLLSENWRLTLRNRASKLAD